MPFSNNNPFLKFFPDSWSVNLGLIPINAVGTPSISPASASASAVATTPSFRADVRPASASASAVATTPTLSVPSAVSPLDPLPLFYIYYDLVDGGKTTYSYLTDVFRSRYGLENRTSCIDVPRKTLEFNAFLDPTIGDDRDVLANLAAHLPTSHVVGILERPEELTILSSSGFTVTVQTTRNSEWLTPGKRVAVIGSSGRLYTYVISVVGNVVTLNDDPASYLTSACLVPITSCYLSSSQNLDSSSVGEVLWRLQAQSVSLEPELGVFGGSGSGLGITLPPTVITVGDIFYGFITAPVWDFSLGLLGNSYSLSLDGGLESEDSGSVVGYGTTRNYPDVIRQIKIRISGSERRQWLKAFFALVRGRACPFFLPSNTSDVVAFSNPSAFSFRVYDDLLNGYGSFSAWHDISQSHRFLRIISTVGGVHYVQVNSYVANGDGTITLTMASSLTVSVQEVSLMELVRFDSDELSFQWSGNNFSVELTTRTVEQ